PPEKFEIERQSERLSSRLTVSGSQQPARILLSTLHLAPECLERRQRPGDQPDLYRLRRRPGLQVELAQSVNCVERPVNARCLGSETNRTWLRTCPKDTCKQTIVWVSHKKRELIGLRTAIGGHDMIANVDRF